MSVMDGATIAIYQGSTLVTTLTADSNGQANCQLPLGTYQITISKTGYVTTTYQIIITANNTMATFNLPAQPLKSSPAIMQEQLSETITMLVTTPAMTEALTESIQVIVNTPVLSEALSESIDVQVNEPIISDSISETLSVVAVPTTWELIIVVFYGDPSLSNGTISPSGTVNGSTSVSLTAITEQYSIYAYALADSIVVTDNRSTTFEPVGTTHAITFPNQALGTIHQLAVFFLGAWELVISASGGGTTSKTGTYEIAYTQSISVSATPNANQNMGDGHTKIFFLDHWELDGQIVGSGNVSALPKGTSHTLVAVFGFYYSPPY